MIGTREFAQLDVRLRSGAHISRSSYRAFELVSQNFDELAGFYRSYGSRLMQHPEGFFFLLTKNSLIPVRRLPRGAMHLGQFIALKTRDAELTRTNGRIRVEVLVADLEASVPKETLSRVYAPKQKEILVGARVHEEVMRSLRLLADLEFIEIRDGEVTPLEAIQRFADLARHGNEPSNTERLALQVNRGVTFDEADADADEGLEADRPIEQADGEGAQDDRTD